MTGKTVKSKIPLRAGDLLRSTVKAAVTWGSKTQTIPILLLNNYPGLLEVNQITILNDHHFYLICFPDFLD